MSQTVLVAGATGTLGSRITHYLLAEPNTIIRMLLRPGALKDVANDSLLTPLLDRGAELITAHLADRGSLRHATMGVDVIVSALQGRAEVITDGQIALLQAARQTGVRRFVPSDFAVDFFKAPRGELEQFDMRRRADAVVEHSGLEFVHVLNGVFMDFFLGPNPMFDLQTGIVRTWGVGDEPFEATSIEDVARYTAKAALDRDLPNGKFAVAGAIVSFDHVAEALARLVGCAYHRERLGSIADLKTHLEILRADGTQQRLLRMHTYQLYLLTGQTSLENLQNDRYPDIKPESFAAFLHRKLGIAARRP